MQFPSPTRRNPACQVATVFCVKVLAPLNSNASQTPNVRLYCSAKSTPGSASELWRRFKLWPSDAREPPEAAARYCRGAADW